MHVIRRHRRDDEGAVAVIVALLSVVLFGFGALVIDIGHAEVVRSQAQSTVDAASLAGVRAMAMNNGSILAAVAAVQTYVDENMGTTDLTACTDDPAPLVPADPQTCISTSAAGVTPYQVRVRLPTQHVEATFGGLFGVNSIGISPVAKAQWGQSPPECGPCMPILDENTEQPAPLQSAPVGSSPAQSAPAASAPAGSAPVASAPVASAPAGSAPAGSAPAGSAPAGSAPAGSAPAGSAPAQAEPGSPGLPLAVRQKLPDPSPNPPLPYVALPPGVVDNGCPGPGIYEGAANNVRVPSGTNCTLSPGIYVFDNANLDVQGNLISYLAPDPANPADPSPDLGVTLVFYGSGTLSAENGGSITPLHASIDNADTEANWVEGDAIPGVAIVIDQFDPTVPVSRVFSLGNDFNISGSIYAVDGHTTWLTNSGDCPAGEPPSCALTDAGTRAVIATTATSFADKLIPTIGPQATEGPTPTSSPYAVLVQ